MRDPKSAELKVGVGLIWLILILPTTLFGQTDRLPPRPVYSEMQAEWEGVQFREQIFFWSGMDSSQQHQMELLSDSARPLFFYTNITTPVCIDSICKPMHIGIYWNLIGEYVGFAVYEKDSLTKFDHELFERTDYQKLHKLLLDKNSRLKGKKLEELFDKQLSPTEQVTFKGIKIDAVSGASKAEIRETVVEGALYSCYTIWHLVYSSVRHQMIDYLRAVYNKDLADYFLYSDHEDYQFYAIRQMDSLAMTEALPRILLLFNNAKPLFRTYFLKKIPDALFRMPGTTSHLYEAFEQVDIQSRTLLIQKLDIAAPAASTILAGNLKNMSKNQLKGFLHYLDANHNELTPSVRKELIEVSQSADYAYGYLIRDFLESQE